MAQPLIRRFVEELAGRLELPDPVVEFGAMQVEAEQDGDLRPLFAGRPFTGTDLRAGPGVDRVEDLRALAYGDGEVGTALCLDTLEHCEDPPQACRELARVTRRDGGVCVVSSVMLFGIHGYPSDYFRFTPEGFRSMLQGFDDVWVAGVGDPSIPTQVVGVGAKGQTLGLSLAKLPSLAHAQEQFDRAEGMIRVGPFRMQPRDLAKTVVRETARIAREKISAGRARRAAS
jgi:hypothetical protein